MIDTFKFAKYLANVNRKKFKSKKGRLLIYKMESINYFNEMEVIYK